MEQKRLLLSRIRILQILFGYSVILCFQKFLFLKYLKNKNSIRRFSSKINELLIKLKNKICNLKRNNKNVTFMMIRRSKKTKIFKLFTHKKGLRTLKFVLNLFFIHFLGFIKLLLLLFVIVIWPSINSV